MRDSVCAPLAGDFATQESALRWLEHSYHTTSTVVRDLQAYKSEAAEAAAKLGVSVPCQDSTGGDAAVFVKPDTHVSAVKARLEYIGYAVSVAGVALDDDTLGVLWTELVMRNITAAEREAFFEWLKVTVEASSVRSPAFIDNVRAMPPPPPSLCACWCDARVPRCCSCSTGT